MQITGVEKTKWVEHRQADMGHGQPAQDVAYHGKNVIFKVSTDCVVLADSIESTCLPGSWAGTRSCRWQRHAAVLYQQQCLRASPSVGAGRNRWHAEPPQHHVEPSWNCDHFQLHSTSCLSLVLASFSQETTSGLSASSCPKTSLAPSTTMQQTTEPSKLAADRSRIILDDVGRQLSLGRSCRVCWRGGGQRYTVCWQHATCTICHGMVDRGGGKPKSGSCFAFLQHNTVRACAMPCH